MSVQNPTAGPAYGRGRRSRPVYDHAAEPAPPAGTGARSPRARRRTEPALTRWLAVGALALVTILFVLIVLQ